MAVVDPVPRMVAEPGGDDHRLVAAVRRGDDRAFELLYERYHRRIHAYVMGMVKDHGRAEDITQEVFVSALRRMRETERPIAFKPWIYEIAKNACIDQFRRSRRAQEVSLQADEGLNASDYGKLVGSEPTPDAAVAAKQDLDNLRGAFVGLSDTHHEILVMRELEGLSYREIGERLGMSRPAVESTLFRARRRLSEEYDDLATGARCRRVQGLIETAASSRLGTREERRLSRHVAHCQPCRREALAAGLDESILTHVPLPRRAARKIAGLLPFPLFGRSRSGDGPGWSRATADAVRSALGRLGQARRRGGCRGGGRRRLRRRHARERVPARPRPARCAGARRDGYAEGRRRQGRSSRDAAPAAERKGDGVTAVRPRASPPRPPHRQRRHGPRRERRRWRRPADQRHRRHRPERRSAGRHRRGHPPGARDRRERRPGDPAGDRHRPADGRRRQRDGRQRDSARPGDRRRRHRHGRAARPSPSRTPSTTSSTPSRAPPAATCRSPDSARFESEPCAGARLHTARGVAQPGSAHRSGR